MKSIIKSPFAGPYLLLFMGGILFIDILRSSLAMRSVSQELLAKLPAFSHYPFNPIMGHWAVQFIFSAALVGGGIYSYKRAKIDMKADT